MLKNLCLLALTLLTFSSCGGPSGGGSAEPQPYTYDPNVLKLREAKVPAGAHEITKEEYEHSFPENYVRDERGMMIETLEVQHLLNIKPETAKDTICEIRITEQLILLGVSAKSDTFVVYHKKTTVGGLQSSADADTKVCNKNSNTEFYVEHTPHVDHRTRQGVDGAEEHYYRLGQNLYLGGSKTFYTKGEAVGEQSMLIEIENPATLPALLSFKSETVNFKMDQTEQSFAIDRLKAAEHFDLRALKQDLSDITYCDYLIEPSSDGSSNTQCRDHADISYLAI